MSLLESKAAFAKRVQEIGLMDVLDVFSGRGWDTFGSCSLCDD